jgi:hypothetical protein
MRYLNSILIIFLLASIAHSSDSRTSEYLELKRKSIAGLDTPLIEPQQIKSNEIWQIESHNLLAKIIPKIEIPGFESPLILPETFLPELGRDYSDGYLYTSSDGFAFVSHTDLFDKKFLSVMRASEIKWPHYTNAVATSFMPLKSSSKSQFPVWLVLLSQDIGPFPPNAIRAIVIKNDTIVMFSRSIQLTEIELCKQLWKNSIAPEDVRFKNYIDCYQKNISRKALRKMQIVGKEVSQRAIEIAELIELVKKSNMK